MREDSMKKLAEQDSLLHTVVHYPRSSFTEEERNKMPVPVESIHEGSEMESVESALVGELVLPAEKVFEQLEFNSNGFLYWDWPEAYGERPDTSGLVEEWYRDSFIEEKID
jgi:hypothetical protein